MSISLEKWQERLERHFSALAAERAGSGFPLFALEHGLGQKELEEMGQLLHSRLVAGSRLGAHWLAWIVYATECGYDYDGDEYWSSFEERTPYWQENGRRGQLRDWFSKFRNTYHGVEPSGPWADWFSIIAWPITHAILPKYLQLQLARALYDLRYKLAGLESVSPSEVGSLLATNACDAPSRFRIFLQQEELAGRIVLGLLGDAPIDASGPIYPPALNRIILDLERTRKACEWLKVTRSVVADRFKGVSRTIGSALGRRDAIQATSKRAETPPPRVRPTLLLRPSRAGIWSVFIEVPSFGDVARLNPDLRAFLRSTRCRIADSWVPAGGLLSNAQRRVLREWPILTQPLVKFDRPHATLDHLLESECRLAPGNIWICRVGADGVAREVKERVVRPGYKYIVLSRQRFLLDRDFITTCKVECAGISASLISLPQVLSSEDIKWLQQRSLKVARTIQIWPAGLSGRGWDGEGHSEWLTTEAPCFGIVHDHPVDTFILSLNGGPALAIEPSGVGEAVFVRIPPLPAGRHCLSVKALRSSTLSVPSLAPAAEGFVTVDVREPEPWIPGTTLHAGLAVYLDPQDPSLDTFWEGSVGVSILGPEGYQVRCSISLLNASGEETLSKQIGKFTLPVTSGEWVNTFGKLAQDENFEWEYLESASARISIKGEELGEYIIRLEKDFMPVRWTCRIIRRARIVRLIDDTGRDENVFTQFYSFNRPAEAIPLDRTRSLTGFEPEAPGGLYFARNGQHRETLIVSALQANASFKELAVFPDLRGLEGCSTPSRVVLRILGLWSEARIAGPLASARRDSVTRQILSCLYTKLYGGRWAKAEARYLSNLGSKSYIQELERSVGGLPSFAVILRREHQRMEAGTDPGARWFSEVAARYRVCSEPRLCEFALRLASQPQRLFSIFGRDLEVLLSRVSDKTNLLRGARFLALLSMGNSTGGGSAIPRWLW